MTARVTVSGLDAVEAQLARAQRDVTDEAEKVVGRGCLNIKRDWQQRWRNLRALPGLARTITYDVGVRGRVISGEVGPDHRRGGQATLGHIPEYGMPSRRTPPHPGGRPALEAEAPRFTRAVADLGERLIR